MNDTKDKNAIAYLVSYNISRFTDAAESLAKAQAELQIANTIIERFGDLEEFERGNADDNKVSRRMSVYAKLQQEAKEAIQDAARRILVYAGELRELGYNTNEDPSVKEANAVLGINA